MVNVVMSSDRGLLEQSLFLRLWFVGENLLSMSLVFPLESSQPRNRVV